MIMITMVVMITMMKMMIMINIKSRSYSLVELKCLLSKCISKSKSKCISKAVSCSKPRDSVR